MPKGNRTDRRGHRPRVLDAGVVTRIKASLVQRTAWEAAAKKCGLTLSEWARSALDTVANFID